MRDFDWFLEHLEVARWNSNAPGKRDIHTNCPVCGGSNPLHVTETPDKTKVNCFNCSAKYAEIVEALGDDKSADDEEEIATPVVIRKKRAGDPDALQILADYCGVDRSVVKALHVRDGGNGEPLFDYPSGAVKRRHWTDEKKYTWDVPTKPRPIWPYEDPMPEEAWFTEGETDAIVLRSRGITAYSLGSVTDTKNGVTVDEWREMADHGLQRAVIAGDADKVGREASKNRAAVALEAGLDVTVHSPTTYSLLTGKGAKDWRAWHLAHPVDVFPPLGVFRRSHVLSGEGWLSDFAIRSPLPLLLDYLHPTDHTILFGDGGTGKGVIAAQWIARLINELGYVVLLVDYEKHSEWEWSPRVEAFGGDRDCIKVVQPAKAIWDDIDMILGGVDELRSRFPGKPIYMVVDSVTYACMGSKVEDSVTAARYTTTITQVGLPTLSLAHTTKTDADPKHPFGSVFWSNGARLTIGVSRKEGKMEPGTPRLLKGKKENGGAAFKSVEIPWDWSLSEKLPDHLDFLKASQAPIAQVRDALASGPMLLADIETALKEDGDESANSKAIGALVKRYPDTFISDGKKPARWRLVTPLVPVVKFRPKVDKNVEMRGDE